MAKESSSAFGIEGMLCSTKEKVLRSLLTAEKEISLLGLIQENSFILYKPAKTRLDSSCKQ